MPARSKLKELETAKGKPMSEVLTELYSKCDGQTEVAKALGVSQSTVSTWLAILGLKEKTIVVPRERGQQKQIA